MNTIRVKVVDVTLNVTVTADVAIDALDDVMSACQSVIDDEAVIGEAVANDATNDGSDDA